MHPVVWWIAAAVVFFILELATASFFFLWIGAGAALTALLSFFVETSWIEYATFAVSSLLLVTLSRRWAPRFTGKKTRLANVDSLVAQAAVVTKVDGHNSSIGYVKVEGQYWKAESENREPLQMDGKVTVVAVKGNILVL